MSARGPRGPVATSEFEQVGDAFSNPTAFRREVRRRSRCAAEVVRYQMVRAAGVSLWRLSGASLVTRGQPFWIAVA